MFRSVLELTHWGKERTVEEILKEIVYPDTKLAHGYEKPVRLSSKKTGKVAEGFFIQLQLACRFPQAQGDGRANP